MTTARPTRVVVALDLAPSLLERLAPYDVVVLPPGQRSGPQVRAALTDARGLLVSSKVPVGAEVVAAGAARRVISTMSVGVDHIDLDAALAQGITVTITPVLSDAVADLTMLLMTMVLRRIPDAVRAVAQGRWRDAPLGSSLADKELLLVGFGRIGQAVATRALAARMRVRYIDPRVGQPDAAGVTRAERLLEALPGADVVSLHVDLHGGTHHLVGRRELAAMKPSAVLVNTARGSVVDQAALLEALEAGSIAGAGLDVLADEPPDPEDPLLRRPDVVVLPHIGSATTETRHAMAACAVDNLLAVLADGTSPFSVGGGS